jgi:hypothetical protein
MAEPARVSFVDEFCGVRRRTVEPVTEEDF